MRTEHEMMALILSAAKQDDRIRAVFMNGSRTNLNAPKDIFQDYDIVYVVEETASFQLDKTWIDQFGDRLYMQYPEENTFYKSDIRNCYGWLIQFADGNRLDLHVSTLEHVLKDIKEDRLCKILLDKDGCLPEMPEATDEDFWVNRPTEMQFLDTCNEFWWCLNNVAKGLWREEIPYVMDMMNHVVRPQLARLLEWKIGFETDFTVSVGKSGKYMDKWLDESMWHSYLSTYPCGEIKAVWDAVFIMCDLFDDVAREVSMRIGVEYNTVEARNSLKFLRDVQGLPKDAKDIY